VAFAATVFLFLALFHRPATGTWHLTHDKAWVLLYKTGQFVPGGRPDPAAGIYTRRLLVLNSLLPWDKKNVFAVPNVRVVSPRLPEYRARYAHLLRAGDDELLPLLPPVGEKYDWFTAFSPTTYYLGYADGDRLGTRVYLENVRHFWPQFVRHVVWLTATQLTAGSQARLAPRADDVVEPLFQRERLGVYLQDPRLLKHDGTDPYGNAFHYFVFKPGVRVLDVLLMPWRIIPAWLLTLFFLGGTLASIWRLLRRTGGALERAIVFVAVWSFGFVVYSNAVLYFRPTKELVVLLPMLSFLFASCLVLFSRIGSELRRGRSPA
jgi:hypothetical protein